MVERASAERLQRPAVDIGQLHWSTANYQPLQETAMWGGLVDMYEEGLVRAVGLSNYGPKQLQKIAKCAQTLPSFPCPSLNHIPTLFFPFLSSTACPPPLEPMLTLVLKGVDKYLQS
jgi:aryl-alcohol dehydrogenase-like predicted oxidoreductase